MKYLLPSPTSIWLGWHEVPDGYKNGVIMGYRITLKDTRNEDPPTTITYSPNVFSANLDGLPSFVDFKITLLAFTIKGDGPGLTHIITTDESGKLLLLLFNTILEFRALPRLSLDSTWFLILYGPTVIGHAVLGSCLRTK